MEIYATFNGTIKGTPNRYKWVNVVNSAGISKSEISTSTVVKDNFRVGSRYLLKCASEHNKVIIKPSKLSWVKKNPICDNIRYCNDTFYFVRGKFKGKTDLDIDKDYLVNYAIWLAESTKNEATIINCLKILKKYG